MAATVALDRRSPCRRSRGVPPVRIPESAAGVSLPMLVPLPRLAVPLEEKPMNGLRFASLRPASLDLALPQPATVAPILDVANRRGSDDLEIRAARWLATVLPVGTAAESMRPSLPSLPYIFPSNKFTCFTCVNSGQECWCQLQILRIFCLKYSWLHRNTTLVAALLPRVQSSPNAMQSDSPPYARTPACLNPAPKSVVLQCNLTDATLRQNANQRFKRMRVGDCCRSQRARRVKNLTLQAARTEPARPVYSCQDDIADKSIEYGQRTNLVQASRQPREVVERE